MLGSLGLGLGLVLGLVRRSEARRGIIGWRSGAGARRRQIQFGRERKRKILMYFTCVSLTILNDHVVAGVDNYLSIETPGKREIFNPSPSLTGNREFVAGDKLQESILHFSDSPSSNRPNVHSVPGTDAGSGSGSSSGINTTTIFTTRSSSSAIASASTGTSSSNGTNGKLYRRIHEILTSSPLIDGHNDLPWNIRKFIHRQINDFNFTLNLRSHSVYPWSNSTWSHTDIPRLRAGLVGAQFWVAYVPCEAQFMNAVQITLEQIDLIRRLIAKYPNDLKLALSADDIERAHGEGKIGSLIAVEGGHSIGNSLATLRAFYDLGVRSMTLTHNCNTPWADSSLVEAGGHKPQHGGLTEFGRSVVREMNRLGMLVDLSHTSKMTMKDALNESQAPVIFSHSSAYAICNSSRNVPDDILRELVWNRGIVMVTFYNFFVRCHENATVRDVAEHINYIRDYIGVKHIGIGAGFDGINKTPRGLEDASMYPNLFVELARNPRWSDDDLKKVAGQNFLKVFREAEHIRDKMKNESISASHELISPRYLRDQSGCKYNVNGSVASTSIH